MCLSHSILEILQLLLTIKLVLDNIVESLKKKENQVMVLGCREQEPAGRKGFQQVEQFISCYHGEALQVWGHLEQSTGNIQTVS